MLHERYGGSNHRQLDCFFHSVLRRTTNKHQRSALLALCEGNPPVFPLKKDQSVSMLWRHLDCAYICPHNHQWLFVDTVMTLKLNMICSASSVTSPFELVIKTVLFKWPTRCLGILRHIKNHDDVITWKCFRITGHLWGESPVTGGFPSRRTRDVEIWCRPKQAVEQTMELPIIWGAARLMWHHCELTWAVVLVCMSIWPPEIIDNTITPQMSNVHVL